MYNLINPIEHSKTKELADKYKVEPYVIPADIYGASNLIGRGGWTWYTGSSSWYYLAGIEYILGLKIINNVLTLNPVIPKEWKEFKICFKYGQSIYNIDYKNKKTGKVKINNNECDNKIRLENTGEIYNIEIEC